MIKAELGKNYLFMEGHAEGAPKGQNLYCAAASTLAATAALAVINWRDAGLLVDCAFRMEPGFAFIRFIPKPEDAERLYEIFDAILNGLRLLEKDTVVSGS